MEPRKLVITERAREQLVNVCDIAHPKEAGGYLFGSVIDDAILVEDTLPLRNQTKRPQTSFAFTNEDLELADLYAKSKGMKRLGIYHSHPDGSMPSLADIRGAKELEVWILHKRYGSHEFLSSWYRTHLKLEFESGYLGFGLQQTYFQLSTGKLYIQQIPTICRILKKTDSMFSNTIKSDIKSILGTSKQTNRYLTIVEKEGLIEKKKWEGGPRGLMGDIPDYLFTISDKGSRLLKLQAEYENRLKELFLKRL